MAYSFIEYNADGATNTFTIPFLYVNTNEITVFSDGAQIQNFSFTSQNTINIDPAPALNTVVRIQRTTNIAERAVDFVNGSVLSEEDLDTAFLQIFHASQEAVDRTAATIGLAPDGLFDAQSRRLKNLAAPIAGTDAANKQYVDNQTAASITAANAAAAAASASATTAATQASLSTTEANRATTQATSATTQATNAATSATNAANTYQQTLNALTAAKIPATLNGKAKQFLQVKTDESGYELVASVAAPVFFGFKMSQDGSEIELTYGRDTDFDTEAFDTWTLGENISFDVQNNNLVIVL